MTESTRFNHRKLEPSGNRFDETPSSLLMQRGQEGIRLLLEAYLYAFELGCDIWDFAVEIEDLHNVGCTGNEFRWLVCQGFVDHAIESTSPDEPKRTFRRCQGSSGWTFRRRTCFVLTEAGRAFAQAAVGDLLHAPLVELQAAKRIVQVSAGVERKPLWDYQRQELRLGDAIVKQFKVPAANQERILAAFEEEGWPVRIDDPLPPNSEQNPKRRLHDTINSLNRNQKQNLIRFTGDGSGQGIRWELAVDDGR